MKTTQNLGLKKPDPEDFYNVADFNYNADVIDAELAKRVINAGYVPAIKAGLDINKPVAATVGYLYVATDTQRIYRYNGLAWQLIGVVKWNDIAGKPTSFAPSAHASTHASGGRDPLTPADIGAASQSELYAHLDQTAAHGATSDNIANRIVMRDGSGNFSAGIITASLNGNASSATNADKVDNIHFQVLNGVLQYNDGTGWKTVANTVTVQRGTSIVNRGEKVNVTISTVDVTKSFVIVNGTSSGDGYGESAGAIVRATLTSGTQLELYNKSTSRMVDLTWEVIQIA